MIKKIIRLLMNLVLLIGLVSCSGWHTDPPDPPESSSVPDELDSSWAADPYFFRYDMTGSGTVHYLDNDEKPQIATVESIHQSLSHDTSEGIIRLRINIALANADFDLGFFLAYLPESNTYHPAYSLDDPVVLYTIMLAEDYKEINRSKNFGWHISEDSISIVSDSEGALTGLNLDLEPDKPFDLGTHEGEFFDQRKEVINSINLDIDFVKSGYLAKNSSTQYTIPELRFYNSEDIIKNVPAGIDVFNQPEEYLDDLVAYLIEGQTDDGIKMKIINDWIADNICYDFISYYAFDVNYEDNLPYIILETKHAVCQGFARLFSTMCQMAGIDAPYIHGKSRSKGIPLGGGDYGGGHAWNMVQLNENYYIIDVTSNQEGRYQENEETGNPEWIDNPYINYYFLISPQQAIIRRWPTFNQWQALDNPVNAKEFQSTVYETGMNSYISELCYQNDISFDKDFAEIITINGQPYEFIISAEEDTELLMQGYVYDSLTDDNIKQSGLHFMEYLGDNQFKVNLYPHESGDHYFYLCQKGPSFAGIQYSDSLEILATLHSRTYIPKADGPYPISYTRFINEGCRLISPRQGILTAGESYQFEIYAPKNYGIGVFQFIKEDPQSEDEYSFEAITSLSGDNYKGSITTALDTRCLRVGVKLDPDSSSYSYILNYQVEEGEDCGCGRSAVEYKTSEKQEIQVIIEESPELSLPALD